MKTHWKLKTDVLYDTTLSLLTNNYRRFRWGCCLYLQSLSCPSPLLFDSLHPEHGASQLTRNGSTQRHMLEEMNICQRRCENPRSRIAVYWEMFSRPIKCWQLCPVFEMKSVMLCRVRTIFTYTHILNRSRFRSWGILVHCVCENINLKRAGN